MNNKDTLEILGLLLDSSKQVILGKNRQTGKSNALENWRKTFDKFKRTQDRKETIKRLFNI